MTYDVLVKQTENRYLAVALGYPNVAAEAQTRSDAIRQVSDAVAAFIANSEIVQIELPKSSNFLPRKSLSSLSGMWSDDETFDDFVRVMKQHRDQLNADPRQL